MAKPTAHDVNPTLWLGRALRTQRAGEEKLSWHRFRVPSTLLVTSPAFGHGMAIPREHAGRGVGSNISPALRWTGMPPATRELVLVVEDWDAPLRRPFVHLALAGIHPKSGGVAAGELNELGVGTMGRRGWSGPRPIPGHGPHHYVFQLFALDAELGLPADASPAAIGDAMAGHVIARGRLDGTFER
jgi:Raf kinase inhibitor-like YbhB/YbcL family protein